MTADEVRAALAILAFPSQEAVAEAFEMNTRTVRRWEREGIPRSAARVALRLMLQLREHAAPSAVPPP